VSWVWCVAQGKKAGAQSGQCERYEEAIRVVGTLESARPCVAGPTLPSYHYWTAEGRGQNRHVVSSSGVGKTCSKMYLHAVATPLDPLPSSHPPRWHASVQTVSERRREQIRQSTSGCWPCRLLAAAAAAASWLPRHRVSMIGYMEVIQVSACVDWHVWSVLYLRTTL